MKEKALFRNSGADFPGNAFKATGKKIQRRAPKGPSLLIWKSYLLLYKLPIRAYNVAAHHLVVLVVDDVAMPDISHTAFIESCRIETII